MKKRIWYAVTQRRAWAAVLGAALCHCHPAAAANFAWASDADAASLDPYAKNEVFLQSFDANFYEPLVRRDGALKLEPALAVRWTQIQPTLWRFDLRHGVTFHDGSPFTAADVMFSFDRVAGDGSNMRNAVVAVKEIRKLDDFTVEFVTKWPDPILPGELAAWDIMSKVWCEANDSSRPADLANAQENYASEHENGTGPFIVKERETAVRTVLAPNPTWWDKPKHNLTSVVFEPIADDETRVAALLSGKIDMIYTVPPEATDRIAGAKGFKIVEGPALRTLFLGFDQSRPQLLDSSLKGKNPFKEKPVRLAIAEAIDETAIKDEIMRGYARPAALLVGPGVNGYNAELDKRPPYDPEQARTLLAQAGYSKGFEVGMDCPNDRYVNDEQICDAVSAMLAKIGIAVKPQIQTRSSYFMKIGSPGYKTSFYLLGWVPYDYDAGATLRALAHSRDPKTLAGEMNLGGYSNPALDALIDQAEIETDPEKRVALLRDAMTIVRDEVVYVPLHQQPLIWAAKSKISLVQPEDDWFPLRYVWVK